MPTCKKATSLYFRPTDSKEIINTINSLKLKTSCEHDNVNTLLIKQIKFAISLPLSIAVSKLKETGVFPSKLKITKVIPIYITQKINKVLQIIDQCLTQGQILWISIVLCLRIKVLFLLVFVTGSKNWQ